MTDQAVRPTGPGPAVPPGAPPGGFTGRARELRDLHTDIARAGLGTLSGRPSPHSRVLLIAGRPGSGRTALAEEFVRRHAGDYPGGVLRVRLTDPGGEAVPVERTARDLLAAFGGDPAPAGASEDELLETVRETLASRRVLLLLDDIAEPEQLLNLLPDSRDCLVVAVGEGPLTGVTEVRPCAIGGLDRAAAVELLGRRAGSTPRATVDPRSVEALAEACGDLPAALHLAGGWLAARPKMSVADAAKQLTSLDESDPLRRVFRLVYESLTDSPARLLRLLTLAPVGAVDAHTASALAGCSVAAAHTALEHFQQLGLLRHTGGGPDSHRQYELPRCLDPLLRERLAERERPADVLLARARMLERTVRQLQACAASTEPSGSEARKRLAGMPRTLRFADAAEARAWLEARRPALLAAARLAVADRDGQLDTLARRLISALARAFDAHRSPQESAPELYRLHELVLGVAERVGLPRERAAALLNLADLDVGSGRLTQALDRYRTALDASRPDGRDGPATGRALESLGGTYAELQDWVRAADWYGRALALRQARGEREAAARVHQRLGAVHSYAGRFGEALRAWKAAAAEYRRLRNPQSRARALGEVARVQEYAGRPHEALRTCRQALEAARGAADRRLEAALLVRLADTCDRLGESSAGYSYRAEAERLLDRHPRAADGRAKDQRSPERDLPTSEAADTYEIHSGPEKN